MRHMPISNPISTKRASEVRTIVDRLALEITKITLDLTRVLTHINALLESLLYAFVLLELGHESW